MTYQITIRGNECAEDFETFSYETLSEMSDDMGITIWGLRQCILSKSPVDIGHNHTVFIEGPDVVPEQCIQTQYFFRRDRGCLRPDSFRS